jgi:hypothetical protein
VKRAWCDDARYDRYETHIDTAQPQGSYTKPHNHCSSPHYIHPLYITDSPHSPPPNYSPRSADSPCPARTPDWYRTGYRAPWESQTCCPSPAPSLDRGMRVRVPRCCCCCCTLVGVGTSAAARGRRLSLRVGVVAAVAWVVERCCVEAGCSLDSL